MIIHQYSVQKIKMHETLLAVVVRLHVMAPKYTDNFQSIIVRIIIRTVKSRWSQSTRGEGRCGTIVQNKAFVSSALVIGEWSGSRHNRVIPGDRAPSNH